MNRFLLILLLLLTSPLIAPQAHGQVVTIPQLLEQQSRWPQYARDQKPFIIEGRFLSRVTESFSLEKFEPVCRHPATIRLPDRIRRGQTIEVSGSFVSDGTRLHFQVSRLQVREMDHELLRKQSDDTKDGPWSQLLQLAEQFTARADFYSDDVLRQEITAVRTTAINKRKQELRGQSAPLKQLLETATQLQLPPTALQGITWEWLLAEAAVENANPAPLAAAAKMLPGWDQKIVPPAQLREAFQKNPTRAWENVTETDRPQLHRLLYSRLQLAAIRQTLKPDGSNGLAIARQVREELPLETTAANEFEHREIQWHLDNAPNLSRQQLIESSNLLDSISRNTDAAKVRARWLAAQEQRFGTQTLAGLLRTAEENLFASEQWPDPTLRENAVKLLKTAWERASKESPSDVEQIANRLKTLGWEHFRGNWMTSQQISQLPNTDLDLAAREGRVVPGMTAAQVTQILGKPTRISRLGGSSQLREFWNYSEAGLIIRLRRNLQQSSAPLMVEDVARRN
jgi:hypothetical protein